MSLGRVFSGSESLWRGAKAASERSAARAAPAWRCCGKWTLAWMKAENSLVFTGGRWNSLQRIREEHADTWLMSDQRTTFCPTLRADPCRGILTNQSNRQAAIITCTHTPAPTAAAHHAGTSTLLLKHNWTQQSATSLNQGRVLKTVLDGW